MTVDALKTDADVTGSAAILAVMEARWESHDLLSRWSAGLVPDLLRGHASQLAMSALGRDQLLSLSLETAAADIEAGRSALADGALFVLDARGADRALRESVRACVLNQGGIPLADSTRVAQDVEQRQGRECRDVRELSQRLLAEARLHERLWDDPRLPANARTRLVMLCSVPRLIERAEELAPGGLEGARRRRRTGDAFRDLEAKLQEGERKRRVGRAEPSLTPQRPRRAGTDAFCNAAGWLILLAMVTVVLVGLAGRG